MSSRDTRLARAAPFTHGKVVAAENVTALLEAVLTPGDRVCVEGDNQKQADYLARALARCSSEKVHDLHMVQSGIVLPEHLDVFDRGIASRLDCSYSAPQGARIARMLRTRRIQLGSLHTYLELFARYFIDLTPDVALIAAVSADSAGNLYTGPNTEDTPTIVEAVAFKGGVVIAQVNEIVPQVPRVDIPGDRVHFVTRSQQPFYVEPLLFVGSCASGSLNDLREAARYLKGRFGAQADRTDGHTRRSTADLPNIASLHEPLISESPAALVFRCDSTHSCNDADLSDRFWSGYAIDQIDVTDHFKLRGSVRGDSFKTEGIATSAVPVNPGMEQPCTPPQAALCPWAVGVPVQRTDNLFSWDAGAVYYLTRKFSAFVGASDSHLPIFNTEEPESIGGVPESGTQYEGGLRFSLGRRLAVSTAAYQVKRNSVFTVLLDPQTGLDTPATFSYRVRGWEADLNAEPIDRWSIVGNFSHQNPRISNYPQAPGAVGHLVPSVAPNLANLWTSYDVRLGGDLGFLRLKAGVRYRQRGYTDANNTRILPGSILIGAGISWVLRRIELSVGVNNLADRANWLYGAGTGGGAVPGPGRTVFGRVAATLE